MALTRHDGLFYEQPVCMVCLPVHRSTCQASPQTRTVCTCPERLAVLKVLPATLPVLEEERNRDHERQLEQALAQEDTSVLTEESWRGSANMGGKKSVLTIVDLLWPLEFNWYKLHRENQRRWRLHRQHRQQCSQTRNECGDPHHWQPKTPPMHAWMPNFRFFTDDVLRLKADDSRWEELACWRADLAYWINRLPWTEKRLFLYRLNDKPIGEVARRMGWTREYAKARVQRLSFFLKHAADSEWDRRKALLALVGLWVMGSPIWLDLDRGGVTSASHWREAERDQEALPTAASA